MKWQAVSREVALRHPLYGFGGWLAFWSVVTVLGLPLSLALAGNNLSNANPAAFHALDRLVPWASSVSDAATFAGMAVNVAMVVLWFCKIRSFRLLWIAVDLAVCGTSFMLLFMIALCLDEARPGTMGPFLSGAIPTAAVRVLGYNILALPFLLYMFRSRRFRITFEHRVRADVGAASTRRPQERVEPSF